MSEGNYGWWCSCGAILDVEWTGTPEALLQHRMAHTVAWMAGHTGSGHDISVTREAARDAWLAKHAAVGAEIPPYEVEGQERGDLWLDPFYRMRLIGVTGDPT